MCDGNYIKLNRKMLDWEWYKNQNTKDVFLHCLLKANWKDGKFQGIDIPRGSFVSSYANLATELGISVKSVRVAVNHLITTKEMASKGYSQFSIFTVVKYEQYQEEGKQKGEQGASKGQAKGNNRRREEGKKGINKKSDIPDPIPELENMVPDLKQTILNFIDFREKIKAPMTYNALQLMIKKLNKLSSSTTDQIEILNQSIMSGWKGIFAIKSNHKPQVRKTGFSNFNQRDMDIDSLESQLINNK